MEQGAGRFPFILRLLRGLTCWHQPGSPPGRTGPRGQHAPSGCQRQLWSECLTPHPHVTSWGHMVLLPLPICLKETEEETQSGPCLKFLVSRNVPEIL